MRDIFFSFFILFVMFLLFAFRFFVDGWIITAGRLGAVGGSSVVHARSFSVLVGMFCCFSIMGSGVDVFHWCCLIDESLFTTTNRCYGFYTNGFPQRSIFPSGNFSLGC